MQQASRERLEQLLRRAVAIRREMAQLLIDQESYAAAHPEHPEFLLAEEQSELVRKISKYDQGIAQMRDMLAGRIPLGPIIACMCFTTPDYTRWQGRRVATGVVENEKTPDFPGVFVFLH